MSGRVAPAPCLCVCARCIPFRLRVRHAVWVIVFALTACLCVQVTLGNRGSLVIIRRKYPEPV